jgi:hypothetical protein
MPSVYDHCLPEAFPTMVQVPTWTARTVAKTLLASNRLSVSSFAITADAPDGMVKLWLSEASVNYLRETLSEVATKLAVVAGDIQHFTEHVAKRPPHDGRRFIEDDDNAFREV